MVQGDHLIEDGGHKSIITTMKMIMSQTWWMIGSEFEDQCGPETEGQKWTTMIAEDRMEQITIGNFILYILFILYLLK